MEDRNYYIKLLEHHIINFNEYWEDPIGHTELRDNTEESIKLLKAYFNVILTLEKQFDKQNLDKNDYNKYPDNVKSTIKGIIDIINDGRDLWHPISMSTDSTRTYDHHIQENGRLGFENNPWDDVKNCYYFLNELEEIIMSEKATVDFNKYYDGKWYLFQGYENGSISVRFTKINKTKKGKYTFDGDMIFWATVDSRFDGDGIIINNDCEDVSFDELPYCDGDFENDNELMEFIDHCEEVQTDEEIKNEVHNIMDGYLEDLLSIG